MRHSIRVVPLAAGLLLAACASEEAAAPRNETAMTESDAGAVPPIGSPATPSSPPVGEEAPAPDDDGPAPDQGSTMAIPARFHGEWNGDPSACGTGNSDSRLRIDAGRLRFYESVGIVRDVDVESDRAIDVTAEYSGEGETWRNTRRLSLSGDGDSLTITGDGSSLVRTRCP